MKRVLTKGMDNINSSVLVAKWSKPDTDLLFKLVERFQLNFVVIHDRFNYEKELEYQDVLQRDKKKFAQKTTSRHSRKCKEDTKKDSAKSDQKKYQERSTEELIDRYYQVTMAVV